MVLNPNKEDWFQVKQLIRVLKTNYDYSPFGVQLSGRNLKKAGAREARHGLQGKEGDSEIKGAGNSYDFGARMLDSRLGRWLSIDPHFANQPDQSSYKAFLNSPLNVTDPDGKDDYIINTATGEIQVMKTKCTWDSFSFVTSFDEPYAEFMRLEKNENGLVNFPSEISSIGVTRYGGIQTAGSTSGTKNNKSFTEQVGSGDHYLKPETAAALIGLLYTAYKDYGIQLCMGDMSTSNGSDPATPTFHHGGHGHMGKRVGLDIDFRYIGKDGKSSQGVMTDPSFDQDLNQKFYNLAFKFGFDKKNTYQGPSGKLKDVKTMDGHDNHGHLGMHHKFKNIEIIGNAPNSECGSAEVIIEELKEPLEDDTTQ